MKYRLYALTFLALCAFAGPASALVIEFVDDDGDPTDDFFAGSSSGEIIDIDGNSVVIEKKFGSVDDMLTFHGTFPGGAVGVMSFSETIFNGTGIDWTDFHVELAFQGASGGASTTSTPTMSLLNAFSSVLDCGAGGASFDCFGSVAAGGSLDLSFDVNVNSDRTVAFSITQYPTYENGVPEPSTLALLGLALGGIGMRRKAKS